MPLLQDVTITNFRGFDFLELEGLSKVNLFVGKNNSGKTSILEALFLLIGMSNPALPNRINQIRGLNGTAAKQLDYLFYGLKRENMPLFSARFSDDSERSLKLEAKYKQNDAINNTASISTPELIGVDLFFGEKSDGKESTHRKSSLTIKSNKITSTRPKDYHEEFSAVFLHDKNDLAVLSRLTGMIKRKEDGYILEILQKFDVTIQGIKALPDGIFFDIKNINELVPLNIMGDGIRRFLHIVTAVYEKKGSFVCIDEIENGLHYSVYKLLWKSLLAFSRANDVQLFITTHNIETLACLTSVLEDEEFASMREYAQVFTVSRTVKSEHKAYRYSFEGFKDAIDHETEIRN
ncbi:putative ATP/GTP phosphatase [Hollandina sp. SP2]